MSSPEAGPSTAPSAPLFKKRGKSTAATTRISSSVIDQPPATTSPNHDAGPEPPTNDDEQLSVQDLIVLRSLSRKPTGIELERLNKGERKPRKKPKQAESQEERWAQQMKRGGLMPDTRTHEPDSDDSDSDTTGKPRRLVRRHNFQGETGTVDVDRHMMAYIETEMAKRTGAARSSLEPSLSTALSNPHDQLYAVAEKYRELQRQIRPQQTQDEREGNVALSAAMLSSIPEVDLGIDERMNNIQQTEAAKRALADKARKGKGDGLDQDEAFASARFQHARPRSNVDSGGERKQMATDQVVLDRFKKRQRTFR